MKKPCLFLIPALLLASCVESKVIDIKNVTWIGDLLSIEITSGQLNATGAYSYSFEESTFTEYYSKLVFEGETYYFFPEISNQEFSVTLRDPKTKEALTLYGDEPVFLFGRYDAPKIAEEAGKEYQYHFEVKLQENCQYASYCSSKGLPFPSALNLYGYQSN
jgi:hypothetical protein